MMQSTVACRITVEQVLWEIECLIGCLTAGFGVMLFIEWLLFCTVWSIMYFWRCCAAEAVLN
jgi:hypothetical protein